MRLHEIQQALEVLGVWKVIKKAQGKATQIINTSGVILQRFIEMQDTPASYKGSAGKVVKVNPTEDGLEFSSNSGTDWGEIGGTLSDQTDLQTALDAKLSKSSAILTATDYTPTSTVNVIVCTSSLTITLPPATGTGQTYRIICREGITTIDGSSTDTIKGELIQYLQPGEDLLITDTTSSMWE